MLSAVHMIVLPERQTKQRGVVHIRKKENTTPKYIHTLECVCIRQFFFLLVGGSVVREYITCPIRVLNNEHSLCWISVLVLSEHSTMSRRELDTVLLCGTCTLNLRIHVSWSVSTHSSSRTLYYVMCSYHGPILHYHIFLMTIIADVLAVE